MILFTLGTWLTRRPWVPFAALIRVFRCREVCENSSPFFSEVIFSKNPQKIFQANLIKFTSSRATWVFFGSKNARASKSFEETISETFNIKWILYFSLAHSKIQVMSKIKMQLNQKWILYFSLAHSKIQVMSKIKMQLNQKSFEMLVLSSFTPYFVLFRQ